MAVSKTKSSKGQRKRTEILEAARAILNEEGHTAFTYRRIAEKLDMNLGHIYYYFPTKIGLVRALAEQVDTESQLRYEKIFQSSSEDPQSQFTHLTDFLLDEAFDPKLLNLTIHIWALLAQESDTNNNLLSEIYELDRMRMTELLHPFSQKISDNERVERTAILIAMIEGLSLMVSENSTDLPGIRTKAHSIAKRLIMDPELFQP